MKPKSPQSIQLYNIMLRLGYPEEFADIVTKNLNAQEQEIKARLGQAITAIPGKSESWLMVGFEPEYKLYFRGSNDQPMAMVEVSVYGSENPSAFSKLTGEICKIFEDVLGIAPDHVYVKYQAVANWGWNGGNF